VTVAGNLSKFNSSDHGHTSSKLMRNTQKLVTTTNTLAAKPETGGGHRFAMQHYIRRELSA
jgi:hypothetical protein